MTREEHIAVAEALLTGSWLPHPDDDPTDREIAAAQVHATLALAMTPAPEAPAAPVRASRWRRKVTR